MPADGALLEILEDAQQRGYLGPQPVERQVAHSSAFVSLVGDMAADAVDLGSGGGVPGLVLGLRLPRLSLTLVESSIARSAWLESAVLQLGLSDHVRVVHARVEELGRTECRANFEIATARSFGAPAVLAECAAPLLRQAGLLLVAEPPSPAADRWSAQGLAELGLGPPVVKVVEGFHFAQLTQERPCPPRYPRRVGIPAKRPLF